MGRKLKTGWSFRPTNAGVSWDARTLWRNAHRSPAIVAAAGSDDLQAPVSGGLSLAVGAEHQDGDVGLVEDALGN
jgi:hypothetical protein